ncbi:unnamed protein product [Symbiodinium pilosum]|uniref:BART domain-containing protein n=1 Tax=Symbiodinium pilosum TaxID=2952 RepID=A0A812N556_SYMPI|nr:unnamed protein product [Symbiodinium pilosum]
MLFALPGHVGGEMEEAREFIAHRFCAFALKTLNEDMDPLFEKFLSIFDQDAKEFLQQGETHEQYAAYLEYTATLEEHASNFALQEGYSPGDAGTFLKQLQRAIEEDKVHAEKQVEAFLVHMEKQRRLKLGPDAPPMEQGEVELMKALFRPQTVEDMMEMLLHMTEYTSFSSLMRAKVQQKKFIREMERRKKELMMGETGLAHRFIHFAMKLLNDDLHEFYTRWMPVFAQEAENLQNQGHTHEQYAAFEEYTSVIETRLLDFCAQEGFEQDARGLFDELQRVLQKDQEQVDAQLKRVLAEVEQRKEQMRARATEEADAEKPLILICKPAALGDLMHSLIQQTEYQNFSASMRFRVEQDRMMRMLLAGLQEESAVQGALPAPDADLEVVDVEIDDSRVPAAVPCIGTMTVTVPEGCEAGSQLSLTAPDGQQVCVTIPGGLSPGMSFEVPCRSGGYGGGYSAPAVPAPGYAR